MKQFFLAAALAISATGFSQKVSNKLSFQKGQKLEVKTETKKTSTQEVMGQSMESSMNTTITQIFDIEDVNSNGTTIEHKVKRFVMSAENMGQSQTFDSEKADDLKGEMGALLDKKVLKNKYTMVQNAKGIITAIKLDDDHPNAKKTTDDGMEAMIAQQLGANVEVPKVGDKSMFKILPDQEMGIGESWSDTSSAEGTKSNRVYKITSITDTEIVVDFTIATKVEKTLQIMGTDAAINANDKATGKIIIDRKTGVMKQMTSTSKTEGSVEAQGMSIPITAETIVTTTVKSS